MRVVETRKIDSLGRVVSPIELRKEFDIDDKSDIDICVEGSKIVLKKTEPSCKICRSTANLKAVKDKNIFVCADCQKEIADL